MGFYLSQNKQRLVSHKKLIVFYNRDDVFTVRYELRL